MNTSSHSSSNPPVTLQVIADRLKVSRSLVSMALRDSPKVAKATRTKIQEVAKELNYRPNPFVRAVMSEVRKKQTHNYRATLAFLTNHPSKYGWQKSVSYPGYFAGAQERGESLGYKVEHFWLGELNDSPERFADIMNARGIPGVIIPPLSKGITTLPIDLKDLSAVTFGYTLNHPNIPRICNHHTKTILDAIKVLISRGYQKIGVVLTEDDIRRVDDLWIAGIAVAQRRFPNLKFNLFFPESLSFETFQKWQAEDDSEVIIGLNKELPVWIRKCGRKIPADVGYLHLDCSKDGELAGMYQNTESLGRSAVEMLANLVESNILCNEERPQVLMLDSYFIEGNTLK